MFSKVHYFRNIDGFYTNSLGQCFNKLYLNVDSYKTAYSPFFVCTSIEPELKGLKAT